MASLPPYDFKTDPPAEPSFPSRSEIPQQSSVSKAPSYQAQKQPPPPSIHEPRLLHIYVDGMTHRHLTIVDSDKRTALYTVSANLGSIFSSKPHMRIFRGSDQTNPPIGTADFRKLSRAVDLTIQGRPVSMEATGFFARGHGFPSSIVGPLQWESDGVFGSDLVLVNERQEWLAKFHNSAFAVSKEGKLEISNGEISGAFLDEIVVSGLAVIEYRRRRRNRQSG